MRGPLILCRGGARWQGEKRGEGGTCTRSSVFTRRLASCSVAAPRAPPSASTSSARATADTVAGGTGLSCGSCSIMDAPRAPHHIWLVGAAEGSQAISIRNIWSFGWCDILERERERQRSALLPLGESSLVGNEFLHGVGAATVRQGMHRMVPLTHAALGYIMYTPTMIPPSEAHDRRSLPRGANFGIAASTWRSASLHTRPALGHSPAKTICTKQTSRKMSLRHPVTLTSSTTLVKI